MTAAPRSRTQSASDASAVVGTGPGARARGALGAESGAAATTISPADGSRTAWLRDHRDRIAPLLRDYRGRVRPLLREHRGPVALITIALLLILAGGGLTFATARLTGSPAATNSALADAAATRQVATDVTAEVRQVFSYSYTDLGAARRAASAVLTGRALRQYNQLFSVIARNAPGQQLTVTTRVVRAGVIRLSGDQAQVLVFLDQQATHGGTRATPAAAQLAVTARRTGGHWRITGFESH